MPTYKYRCTECMYEFEEETLIALRNVMPCPRCAFGDGITLCKPLPAAPAFSVKGFSEANGYSKSSS